MYPTYNDMENYNHVSDLDWNGELQSFIRLILGPGELQSSIRSILEPGELQSSIRLILEPGELQSWIRPNRLNLVRFVTSMQRA